MYNDQPPNSSDSSELGHTKGVVISQEDGGIWLVHSVPHFPPAPRDAGGYSYPDTAFHYGQSFLCISLQASEMDLVGQLILFIFLLSY
ncbi:hypothetical protein ANN_27212 [Periplaneta americana]|uniref:Uncharacterized protein n=1 Tax=Periplaneta americana TaxID=6978 RepID=A0ABQ8RXI3_PERAM|nr:hypothetical protein ANN_27212 [Periplaneta americana]